MVLISGRDTFERLNVRKNQDGVKEPPPDFPMPFPLLVVRK